MDSYCLKRKDYKDFLSHLINGTSLENEFLSEIIERAQIFYECNVVGSNYYLSIIIEQLMKDNGRISDFLDSVYNLRNELYFSIEEHNSDFINDLYENHYPVAYQEFIAEYRLASKKNDENKIRELKSKAGEPFENDLDRILSNYYETKIRY